MGATQPRAHAAAQPRAHAAAQPGANSPTYGAGTAGIGVTTVAPKV